ncbi:MAG: phosphatase PAP2 family protein [Planctomycetota bacterium]
MLPFRPAPHRARLLRLQLVCAALLLLVAVGAILGHGMRLASGPAFFVLLGGLGASWACAAWRVRDLPLQDGALILLLVLGCLKAGALATYGVAPFARPLVDPALAGFDAALGYHAPSVMLWGQAHLDVLNALGAIYNTFIPQFLLVVFLLAFVSRDLEALWEYAFLLQGGVLAAVLLFALFPAEGPQVYYGEGSLPHLEVFLEHFRALRAGTFETVHLDRLTGLVCVPSFHVFATVVNTYALRRVRWAFPFVLALNVGMYAATLMVGGHYLADGAVSLLLFGALVLLYRRCFGASPAPAAPAAADATPPGDGEGDAVV